MKRAHDLVFRRRMQRVVWRWLRRLDVSLQDRSDVRQEVFAAAVRSWHSYDPARARPERWLNRITVHVSAHYRDKARHRREELMPDAPVGIPDPEPGVEAQLIRAQQWKAVLEVLQAVDEGPRAVLIAHDLDGVPMTEIAMRLGVPVSTAYKWRARAMAAFQELTQEEE